MTEPSPVPHRWDAFISYRSETKRFARWLRSDLHAVSKHHPGERAPDVWVDQAGLAPSASLSATLEEKLLNSRHLIVLIDPATSESIWVEREVSYWLSTVGAIDRLFLVVVEEGLELRLDQHGNLGPSSALPPSLIERYEAQPKWIDYSDRARWRRRDTSGLSALYAELIGIQAATAKDSEAAWASAELGRVRRTRTLFGSVAVVAVASALVALIFFLNARANAQRAEAQASAAQALLASSSTPTTAVTAALQAAALDDGPTVRSSMLAVAQAARRLTRAITYPEADTTHPPDGAVFNREGTSFAAWGRTARPDSTLLVVWDVSSGAASDIDVPVAGARDARFVDARKVAMCTDSGAVLVDLVRRAADVLEPGVGSSCRIHEFAEGLVLSGGGNAIVIGRSGEVVRVPGILDVGANVRAPSAVLAGPGGVVLAAGTRLIPVTDRAGGRVDHADQTGNALVSLGGNTWMTVTRTGSGVATRDVVAPPDTADVAPVLSYARMTGDVAWVSSDGVLGWSRDGRRSPPLDRSRGYGGEVRLEPLSYEVLVVVYGGTATRARVPALPVPFRVPSSQIPPEPGWTLRPALAAIGSGDSRTPRTTACSDPDAVLMPGISTGRESLLLTSDGTETLLPGNVSFTEECDAVAAGDSLVVAPRIGDRGVTVRENLVADDVIVAPLGERVAVVAAGFPIEILSTAPDDALPKPWDVSGGREGTVAALGEKELFVGAGRTSSSVVTRSSDGSLRRWSAPPSVDIAAARPDGDGAILAVASPDDRHAVIDGDGVIEVPMCAGRTVSWVPSPGYASSVAAAEDPVAVGASGPSLVNCLSGALHPQSAGTQIVDYQVGSEVGFILARSPVSHEITTWTRGDPSSIRTIRGPAPRGPQEVVTFDPGTNSVVQFEPGGVSMMASRNDGGIWRTTSSLRTVLRGVVDARLVDQGTLLLAVDARGAFEMFDVSTGRSVAQDLTAAPVSGSVTGFSARRTGDVLSVNLRTDRDSAATVHIPIGIPTLRRQLCLLYASPECAG